MATVFLLRYLRLLPGDRESVMMLGIYGTRALALEAMGRLAQQPGFRDAPRLVDPLVDDDEEGFHLDEYELDRDHWQEGFFTWTPGEG